MPMKITDHEIEHAEKLLLPENCVFNEERRRFLRCQDSRDVVACPGSGKTTALLAKLVILASRMPFPDGRGVCVITHTNVAIDQIKLKAGAAADTLFRYPNFFGTIQEFTNRFLAIPAYVERFGRREIRMDEDLYEIQARKAFFAANLIKNGAIFGQLKHQLKGLPWKEQSALKVEFFRNLQFRFEGASVDYARGDTGKTLLCAAGKSESYQVIHGAKYGLLEEGYLRYRDAFPLALWYLEQNPLLAEAFANRFAYVFVDEAQDTNAEQLDMLAAAFADRDASLVQFLGDPNQAIYNFVTKEAHWTPCDDPIQFSDTVRYGETISDLLVTVRIDDQISLLPNCRQKSLAPHLLLFEEGEETCVLPAFASLLRDHGLDKAKDGESPGIFKAVGWVGKDKRSERKLCVPSYLPEYEGRRTRLRKHYDCLLSYMQHQDTPGVAEFRRSVLDAACRSLTVGGVCHPGSGRPFTPSTLLASLAEDDTAAHRELLHMISKLALRSVNSGYQAESGRDAIVDYLCKWWPRLKDEDAFTDFATAEDAEVEEASAAGSNVFTDGDISIEVGTVHSVKGETHTATLYLESSYQKKTDSQRLLPFLKGKYPAGLLGKAHHIENLKIAHVAMSRPTHLLAFACCRKTVAGHEDALAENGWELLSVDGG